MDWLHSLKDFQFILELTAVITALLYVFLAAKGKAICFLFGLISSLIYTYLAYTLSFYFDVFINVYYIFMSFYGWFAWKSNQHKEELSIQQMSKKEIGIWTSIGLLSTLVLASVADRFTEAELPYFDAATTVFALIATWLVVKRKLENWLFWIGIDLVATGMYFYKGLYLTSALFLLYTFIAVFAYRSWNNKLQDA